MACKTRVGCAHALCKSYDPEMQTLCLTIIIPFPPPLVCGLIISAAAITERFIDNSSGASVSACVRVQLCVAVCAHVASGSNIGSKPLLHFSPSSLNHHLHLILGAPFLFFFFLSFLHVSCPSTYWVLQTPVSEVWALWTPSEPWHRSLPPFLR